MRRNIALLIMVLMMSVVVIGCGDGNDKGNIDKVTPTGGTIELGDSKINYGTAKPGQNLSLPDEFPVDVLPLLDDARINFVNTNDANQAIGITFLTDKSFDEAVEFYQKVMQDGKVTMESKQDNSYILIGSKGSYAVSISITYQTGEKVFVLLDVTPQSN